MQKHTVIYSDGKKVGHFVSDYVKQEDGMLVFRNRAKPGEYPQLVGMVAAGMWLSVRSKPVKAK